MSATPHGLIIAIEQYDPAGKIPAKLEGTAKAANEFKRWLLTKKAVASADIAECITSGWPAEATTRDAIFNTLRTIIRDWQNKVSELYVFIAGHGLSQRQLPWLSSDYLLTSDFRDFDDGSKCIPLQEMRTKLWMSLGPGEHYYFIDVCRTQAPSEDIELTNLGLKPKPSALGTPAYSTLFSVHDGGAAAVDSGFGGALLDGLAGRGRAKQWSNSQLAVTFTSLKDYVRDRIAPQEVDPEVRGDAKWVILPFNPPPKSRCRIEVVDAVDNDKFQLSIANDRTKQTKVYAFTGGSYEVDLDPDDYVIGLSLGGKQLRRVEPSTPDPIDLYDPSTVRFRHRQPTISIPLGGIIDQPAPPALAFEAIVEVGERQAKAQRHSAPPPAPSPTALTAAHESITASIGQSGMRDVYFSETLEGPVASQDLSLWLSLLGASRIIREPELYSKLQRLQLATFENLRAGRSAIYVLLGFEEKPLSSIANLDEQRPVNVESVPGLDGVMHHRFDPEPGPHRLTLAFERPGNVRLTIVTHCLPNRVTLLVVVVGSDRRWHIRHLMLPLYTLRDQFPVLVRDSVEHLESLRSVQVSVLAQNEFTKKRHVEAYLPGRDQNLWESALYGKWLDPVTCLMAAYDILRYQRSYPLDGVISNLRTYFKGLPDTEAIAMLAGKHFETPNGDPMFLDGALALSDHVPEALGSGKTKQVLDYRAAWTMWVGAMR